MLLELAADLPYTPGDHVGVFACNRQELVDGVLSRLQTTTDPDQPVELQMQKENHTSNGKQHVMRKASFFIIEYSRCRIIIFMVSIILTSVTFVRNLLVPSFRHFDINVTRILKIV
jgi:hypothetical protein